jgi:type I restriction enzyme S subunit
MPRWIAFQALSVLGRTWFATQSYGGTKIQLSLDDIRDIPLLVPPTEEQREIVAFIDDQLNAFGALSDQASASVSLLQERRAALISAAVTGQIDVRHLAKAGGA